MGSKLTHAVNGRIASFKSADKTNVTHLRAHFMPVQEGSGDPAPSNIRPITGWTGLNVERAGGNLLNPTLWPSPRNMGFIHYTNGTSQEWSGNYNASDFVPIVGGADYILHAGFYTQDDAGIAFYAGANVNTYISGIKMSNSTLKEYKFTAPSNANYMRFCNIDMIMQHSDVWLEGGNGGSGTKDTYSVMTIPVSWTEHGEVLGGYVDLTAGKVVATYVKVNLGDYTWNKIEKGTGIANPYFYVGTPTIKSNGTRYVAPTDCYCDAFPFIIRQNMYSTEGVVGIAFDNSAAYISWPTYDDYTKEQFKEAMDGYYLVAPLVTPVEYDIDPIIVKSLAGANNIWNDANGDTDVEYEFTDYMNKRRISLNEPHIITKSGGVGSFWTDLKAPMESLQVEFLPVQSGTGDPSPTNVRPISGSTSTNILHCHKNLLDPALKKFTDVYDIQKWGMDRSGSVANGELILPAGTYTLSISGLESGISPSEWSIKDKDGNYFSHKYAGNRSATFTLSQAQQVGIYMSINDTENNRYCLHNRVMLECGSSATAFEEYSAETIPVSWSSLGEILGGYVDLITGAVYRSWQRINIGQYPNAWGQFNSSVFYTTSFFADPTSSNDWSVGERKAGRNIYCNMLTPVDTQNPADETKIGYYKTNRTYKKYIFMKNTDGKTINEFREWFTENYADAYIVYELENPVFVGYISPIQLKTVIGYNNIWSPAGGDTSVSYWGHK